MKKALLNFLNEKKSIMVKNKEMFLEHQINILEWFLKDHVTLKTGIMAAENSALPWNF